MLPRAFLEPFVSRKSRGTGHLASSSFTTKRTRNGRDPRRILLFASSSTIYSREQSTKTSPTFSSNLFIYLFIYFLFFREGGGGGEGKLGRITLGTHKRHRIQFKHAGVSNLEESSCSWSFETRIYIFYEQRERERKNRSVILSLELCINFHRF